MNQHTYYRYIVATLALAAACSIAATHFFSNKKTEPLLPIHDPLPAQSAEPTPLQTKALKTEERPRPPEEPQFKTLEITLNLRKKENLVSALTHQGVDRSQAQGAAEALKKIYNPRDLKPETDLYIVLIHDLKTGFKDLKELSFEASIHTDITLSQKEDGSFLAHKNVIKLVPKTRKIKGKIEAGYYADVLKHKVPLKILHESIQVLLYEVDFQRNFHPGDEFELMYTAMVNPETLKEQPGELLFGKVILQEKTVDFYRFQPTRGVPGFYNAKGESVRKGLLRTPIDGARISSRYGNRRHPVLGFTREHKGVDFSAPTGTPIMAAGDGVVEKAHRWKGYGNYIRIRHNQEYSTAYAHLSRFATKVRSGKRVKQGEIIGYVGSTGLSSGPHLHYELIRFNQQINPERVKMLPAARLMGKDMNAFQGLKNKIYAQFHPKGTTLAKD